MQALEDPIAGVSSSRIDSSISPSDQRKD